MFRRKSLEVDESLWTQVKADFDSRAEPDNGDGNMLTKIDDKLARSVLKYSPDVRRQRLGELGLRPLYPRFDKIELARTPTEAGEQLNG